MAIARGEITITELYDGDNFYRAWANTPDGSGDFTKEESDRAYLGVYSGREEPTNYSQYKWSRILGESAITAILSNDSHQIGTDENGDYGNYIGAKTTVAVFHGGEDDTSNWKVDKIEIEPADAVTGEIIDTYTYKVEDLKTDEASVIFRLTHKKGEYSPLEKTFTLSKNKQGISGQHATSYFLSFNDTALKKFRETGTMEPAELMMQGMSIKADQKPVPQSGYFKIYEQSEIALDRDQYEQAYADKKLDEEELYVISEKNYPLVLTYTSKEPEERLTYEYTDLIDIMSIKVYWYRDADFEELIDVQTISITSDGEKGDPGENAPLIKLSGDTQVIKISEDGVKTPSSDITVTGKSLNADIEKWEYSVNGGSFSTNLPVGVTRTNNVVTINPGRINFNTLSIQATGAGVSDTFTVAQMADGLNAYTVLLSNESHTFQADTQKAVASSAKTDILAYRGTKRMPVSIQSVTGLPPKGMTYTVSNNGEDNASITFNATTSLTSPSGLVSINLEIDGQQITKEFSYALSFKGDAGTDAKLLYLTSTLETMTFDANEKATPSSQSATIEAKLQNTSGSISFIGKAYNGTTALSNSITLNGSGNSRTFSVSNFPSNATHVSITATLGSLTDTISIFKLRHGKEGVGGAPGQNAIVGYLTNESITLGADSSGAVGSFTPATGTFRMFDGTTEVTKSGTSYSLENSSGLTANINSSTGVYKITEMSADTATAEFKATYNRVSIFKTVTLSKSIAGAKGDSAISAVLTNESITFAANSSGTVAAENYVGNTGNFLLMEGAINRSSLTSVTYSKVSETNVKATISSNGAYTISSMTNGTSVTAGQVTFRTTYKNTTIDKTISISKSIAGQAGSPGLKGDTGAPGGKGDPGAPGAPATSYWLTSSVDTITVKHNGDYDPKKITYYGHSKTGSNNTQNYAGRFIIQTSINGVNFTQAYVSPANTNEVHFSVPEDVLFIKAKFYQAGGTTYLLDEQTTPILHSADGLKGVGLEDKDYQVGTEIFTDKADNSVVYVEVDGKSVGGGSGKNLFKDFSAIKNGYKYEHLNKNGEGGLIINGNSISQKLVSSETYTISLNIRGSGEIILYRISSSGNSPLTLAKSSDLSETVYRKISLTFTPHREELSAIFIYTAYRATAYTAWLEIEPNSLMIEKSETSSAYEPPAPTPDYPIEIHSLNDFDVVSSVGKRNLHKGTSDEWRENHRPEGNWFFEQSTDIKLELGETYTFSIIVERVSNDTVPINLAFGIGNNSFSWDRSNWGNINNIPIGEKIARTFTVSEEDLSRGYETFAWRLRNERRETTIRFKEVKLEKSKYATPWIPHLSDITETDNHPLIDKINLSLSEPLRSVGDVKDRLFRDSDGVWKVERNIDVVNKITGYDSFSFSAQSTGRPDLNRFNASSSLGAVAGYGNAISSHVPTHTNTSFGSVTEESVDVHPGTGHITLFLDNDRASTTIELRNWMMNNNVEIQYIVEPRIESLDQELQDKLNNLRSFQDSNYVYTVISDKTDIISEGLKPILRSTFIGGGYYARWKSAHDLEKTTEYIEQEIKRTQNTAWIRAGMRVGYSSFTQTNPNSVYICGLEYRDGYRDMVLVDKPAEIYIRESNETASIPNKELSVSGIPAGVTAYIIWDNTKKSLFLVYLESKMTATGVSKKRWRNISGQTITFTDSLFAIGEVEV